MDLLTRAKRKLLYTALRTMKPDVRNALYPDIVDRFFPEVSYRCGLPSLAGSLNNLKAQGFSPRFILDIGGYRGEWSREAAAIFEEAQLLIVEANPGQEADLAAAIRELGSRAQYMLQLLGPEVREDVAFYQVTSGSPAQVTSGSSVLEELTSFPRTTLRLRMDMLDRLLDKHTWSPPVLLKLDVQGFELEILKGGSQTLNAAEVVILETSLLEYNRGAPLLDEVIGFMKHAGFVVYDICGQLRRESDAVLFQVDFVFCKESSYLRQHKKFWLREP
jgi:FkbM family methyltransferase